MCKHVKEQPELCPEIWREKLAAWNTAMQVVKVIVEIRDDSRMTDEDFVSTPSLYDLEVVLDKA